MSAPNAAVAVQPYRYIAGRKLPPPTYNPIEIGKPARRPIMLIVPLLIAVLLAVGLLVWSFRTQAM